MTTEIISLEDALLQLPASEYVHTFRNPNGSLLLGADWNRTELIEAMGKAKEILVTGENAQRINHGLAIEYGGAMLFIETREGEK
jgi:hypothetical protein